jgi:hypothetical protein
MKMMVDAWIVRFSDSSAASLPGDNGVDGPSIKAIIDTAINNATNNTFTE